jgi:hypothetical protein
MKRVNFQTPNLVSHFIKKIANGHIILRLLHRMSSTQQKGVHISILHFKGFTATANPEIFSSTV